MEITDYFRYLGAPLKNPRWSWGAIRGTDNSLFLRVWQDQKIKRDGKWFMRITDHDHYLSNPLDRGWQERLQHIALIRDHVKTYMIMCEAVDDKVIPREIKTFDKSDVFVAGRVEEHAGDLWLELADRLPANQVRIPMTPKQE